jgi:hypothetical protein
MTHMMFAFYLVGYVAVAAGYYWWAYKTAPIMEESEMPVLQLWVNPAMAEEQEDVRKAA